MKNRVLLFSVSLVVAASLAVVLQPRLRHGALKATTSLEEPFLHYQLGHSYLKGFGVGRDLKQAEHWLLKAAQKGHVKAQYKLGNLYSHRAGMQHGLEKKPEFWADIPLDYEKAIEWYKLAAEQKYSSAYVRLGYFNLDGIGTPIDYKKSFYWYRKAAKAKEKLGYLWLGYLYSHGLDCENKWANIPNCWDNVIEDYARALKYYELAANQGLVFAQYMTGFLYANGEEKLGKGPQMLLARSHNCFGIPLNYKKAAHWYTKAAQDGHIAAQRRLAYFYYRGNYAVRQNHKMAFDYYLNAAQEGDVPSMRWVGLCNENGTGTYQDDFEAIKWYEKAANFGDVLAQRGLAGLYYRKSFGLQEYLKLAFKWYLEAAAQKDAESIRWVGSCYEDGTGVAQDSTEALEWYAAAARLGDEVAEYYLKEKTNFFRERAKKLTCVTTPASLSAGLTTPSPIQ